MKEKFGTKLVQNWGCQLFENGTGSLLQEYLQVKNQRKEKLKFST